MYAVTLSEEAESYREKGYEAQERGDIDEAISWYQKAANLDPNYAAPHNDLGILFETKGWLDRAESEYQKALAIDPDYKKAYTNLALLYERKGELEKAAFYWMKRYKLGEPNDPWTYEARQRLEKLGLLEKKEKIDKKIFPREIEKPSRERDLKESPLEIKENQTKEETGGWSRLGSPSKKKSLKPKKEDVQRKRKVLERPDNRAEKQYQKAMDFYRKKDFERAIEELKKVRELDLQNRFVKKVDYYIEKSRVEIQASLRKEEVSGRSEEKTKGWTRLGSESRKAKTQSLKIKKGYLEEELERSLKLAEEMLQEEEGNKGLTKEPKAKRRESPSIEKEDLEKVMQESLKSAEERLRDEKSKEKNPKGQLDTRKIKPTTNAGARAYYGKAKNYYEQGEYSRALDTIRSAKKDYPEDPSLLELEQSITNKMKEERIEDHYNEGVMRYRQEDFSGAKKEFEAILDILPE